MTKTEIEQILVREIGIILGGIQVGEDVQLHELGLDSMGFVELLVFIEKNSISSWWIQDWPAIISGPFGSWLIVFTRSSFDLR